MLTGIEPSLEASVLLSTSCYGREGGFHLKSQYDLQAHSVALILYHVESAYGFRWSSDKFY
jgi:hypothetical protein